MGEILHKLNPCADPIFKALFTNNSDEARKALTYFLTAILGKQVSNVQLLPTELPEESDSDKNTVFDLTCVLDDKEFANIEMQGRNCYSSFDNRAEYHCAHLLNHVVTKGTNWDKIPKVYQISVLNFVYDNKDTNNNVLSHFTMKSEMGTHLGDRLNVIFIELPKVERLDDNLQTLSTPEKWAKYFIYADKKEKQDFIQKLTNSEDGIMYADTVLSRISRDFAEWDKQNKYYEAISHEATIKSESFDKGLAQGYYNDKIETARKMLAKKCEIEFIAEMTGLSENEIKKLK